MRDFINWIRNLDIRKVAFVIGFCMLIEKGIVDGDAPLGDLGFSATTIAIIVAWCKLLLWVNGIILVGHTTSAAKWPTPSDDLKLRGGPNIRNAAVVMLMFAVSLFGALLMVVPVYAADVVPLPLPKPIALKAQPSPFIDVTTGGGWYVDLGTSMGVANASVGGNNLFATGLVGGTLVEDGASVDVGVGYIRNGGPLNTWWQARVGASYQNISGGTPSGSISSRWRITEEADVGADIFQQALSAIGNVGNISTAFSSLNGFVPALPSNVSVGASPRQYVGFVLEESQLQGSFGAASGQTWSFAPGVKTGWLWQTLGKDGKPNGNALEVFAQVTWPTQGATFNNVFAANGQPLTIGPAVKEGATYRAGLDYKFGL